MPSRKKIDLNKALSHRGRHPPAVKGQHRGHPSTMTVLLAEALWSLFYFESPGENPENFHTLRKEILHMNIPLQRRMIWVDDDRLTGWCCSHCQWGIIAPRLETTVAVIAFNRIAQDDFAKHGCPTD